MIITDLFESHQQCPECGGPAFSDLILAEKKDACYYKVKASAKVWPSAYASGRLVQCRKKGADNYGKSKNEGVAEEQLDEKCWDGYQQQGTKNKGGRQVPNCVPTESVAEGSEQSFKVTYDIYGSNKENPLYTKSRTVRANSEQEAISILRKLVGGTNYRVEKQGVAEGLNEFAPAGGGGNIPRGPKTPRRGPWDDSGEDPYQLRRYNRSADFFDQFDSDGVDKQKFDKATGEYEGYYFDRDAASGITQIAYFKFDDHTKIGDNDPGVGWYYEPVDEGVAEGLTYAQKHSSWSVQSPKKNEFNTPYKLDQEKEARAHAERIGGKLVKVDQHGHAIRAKKDVAEGSLNEFTPGNSGDDDYDDNDDRSMEATFTIFSKGKAHTGTVIIFPGVTTDVEYHLNGKIYIKNDMDNVYDYDDFITDAANYIQEIIQLEGDGHHFVEPQGVAEGEPGNLEHELEKRDYQRRAQRDQEAEYGPEYQDMVARVKKLAGLGPMKTVYDPAKRVYRNVPVAQQPNKK